VLRIEAVLRRSRKLQAADQLLTLDGVTIDLRNLTATSGGDEVRFTRREIEVIRYLAGNSERPVSREELLEKVWGYARELAIETRPVDIHIAKIRRKIEADPSEPVNLVTVRGAGYRLNASG